MLENSKRIILFLILIISFSSLHAQKEAWNWFIGDSAGISFINGDSAVSVNWYKMKGNEGTGGISDADGNLLFYTNGVDIFDYKNRKLNKNFSLKGELSSTQGKLIVKHPESNEYHVFTNNYYFYHYRLYHFSFIWNGDSAIFTDTGSVIGIDISEGIAAVNHQNNRDILLMNHSLSGDTFYIYCITENGLIPYCKTTKIGYDIPSTYSEYYSVLKFSPSGKLGSISASVNTNRMKSIFRFNNQTASIGNWLNIALTEGWDAPTFSTNDSFIYYDYDNKNIFQYSIKNWRLDSIDKTILNLKYTKPNNNTVCIRNAPKGKLLITRNQQKYVSIVGDANKKYPACNFVDRAVQLKTGVCRFGNFNTNQSYFFTPAIDYKYKQNCETNQFQFTSLDTFGAESQQWIFRKGDSAHTAYGKSVSFTFPDTGIWKVKLIATAGKRIDSIEKNIEIFPIKKHVLGPDIYFCDTLPNLWLKLPKDIHYCTWYTPNAEILNADSIKIDAAGTYRLLMHNDVFCDYWDTLEVIQAPNGDIPTIQRNGDSLLVVDPITTSTYHWYKNTAFTGKTGVGYHVTDTGTYWVEAENSYGCFTGSDTLEVRFLGLSKQTMATEVIYPNPASETLHIAGIESNKQIKFINTQGATLRSFTLDNNQNTVDISWLPNGIYYLQIQTPITNTTHKVLVLK